jgi:hypothetical protein
VQSTVYSGSKKSSGAGWREKIDSTIGMW